jgi:hypothetical protein
MYVTEPDNFLTFPGILYALSPVAALANALHLTADTAGPIHIVTRPGALLLLAPVMLVIATLPLVACDAVAERIGVDIPRRLVLGLGEGVALWGVIVAWGHPEDAIALGFALYALLFGIDGRWNGAAWLFGLGVAMQPLVIVTLPLFLVLAGWSRALPLLARAAVPAIAVLVAPFVANFHLTVKTLLEQPGYPLADQTTPWTGLAPRLTVAPGITAVAAGPGRLILIVLACGVAWWARRWRDRPEMLVWSFALILALRPLTESVMLSYYLYPALAVGMLAASRSVSWRFAFAIVVSAFITVSSQWHKELSWVVWWVLNVGGMVLVVAAGIQPQPVLGARPATTRPRTSTKIEARLQSTRGRGAARRKQVKRQGAKKR